MALRLFNQINNKLFINYKTGALSLPLKEKREITVTDVGVIQEAKEHEDFTQGDGLRVSKEDSKLQLPIMALKYWISSTASNLPPFKFNPSCGQYRFYSNKDKECKKLRKVNPKCRKFKLCNCDQPKKTKCTLKMIPAKCKKKEAPYPSFSESCYEEVYNKPSECKICPWKPHANPSFKGNVAPGRKLHTGRPWKSNESDIENKGKEEPDKILKLVEVAEQPGTLSPVPESANILDKLDIANGTTSLAGKKRRRKKPCKKLPFKIFKYEIGKKKKKWDEACVKPVCVKKKRKLIKDCPQKKRKCSEEKKQHVAIFGGNLFNERVLSMILKKKKRDCPTRHETCKVPDECRKPKCPVKKGTTLDCPTESLLRKTGYPRKPKKTRKKTSSVDHTKEINKLSLIPNPVYNGGVIYNNILNTTTILEPKSFNDRVNM